MATFSSSWMVVCELSFENYLTTVSSVFRTSTLALYTVRHVFLNTFLPSSEINNVG